MKIPEQRADKILDIVNAGFGVEGDVDSKTLAHEVAAEIREAVDEALEMGVESGKSISRCILEAAKQEVYERGFADAIEKAAKVVERAHKACFPSFCEVANEVRALKPEFTKQSHNNDVDR